MAEKKLPLLLLEDDPGLAALIVDELEAEGWQIATCGCLADALVWLEQNTPALVITDQRLPDGNGMELVDHLVRHFPEDSRPGIIVITAFGSVKQAVAALKAGADDFLTKPLDLDHFVICVSRVYENRQLKHEVQRYRKLSLSAGFHGLLGGSHAMRTLFEQIRVIAKAQGPVLVCGESGTGKELVTRAIHQESERKGQPFLAVNCAGIPQELLESEFFGHASGAFTGATRTRRGLLQEADGGTLMLDEIGEMPLFLQAKLLRALQDGSIRPVGQDREEKVDVRIIAATHQDLRRKVEARSFREDLYYRLETFTIRVPPLRERGDDLELLTHCFLQQFAVEQRKEIDSCSPAALEMLRKYDFPGNVRELQNVMERAVAYCKTAQIQVEDLPERLKTSRLQVVSDTEAPYDGSMTLLSGPVLPTMDELQKRYARMVLNRVGGNKRRAAALLGIGRRTLYRWLQEASPD